MRSLVESMGQEELLDLLIDGYELVLIKKSNTRFQK